ncbi:MULTISPECIES: ABC transporter ATP-binding protein [unclassified Herbaspirillum]|uniref:ABC transporter ATP-binding protein n=1 Tax=unclassified Herbaspirillum TaxID=2624150 RepID=UPI001172C7CF|nr:MULTISPECIES: ABC transporter ATP-binding protein [unclassified Herbaspirillum]MBB5393830.1 putative ABC transport system ATP-binding protein [Herbaspirillum sp. SJZ102]TQK01313.1 putative ABC transport system ATP-binding protein [Herbaspirillum sp. SJZ130]TQK05709.1 putative ABC transport system ATP-binding protein [Herbaspirillum sp. SJZ106]
MIKLTDVSHRYHIGDQVTHALHHLEFSAEPGEIISITGPSGSGKSTLLSIMGCLLKPSDGTVSVMGNNLDTLDDAEKAALRRNHLGFIFQSFNLIPVLNAMENVEYPLILCGIDSRERKQRAERMLATVGLQQQMKKRPNQLSGGQKQRVAIARALIAEPDFVLADEPTANLDSHTAADLLALMSDLNKELNTAFIFSTHDPKVQLFPIGSFILKMER